MTYRFGVEQEGVPVAFGETSSQTEAESELIHYALQYAQDGPVKVWIRDTGARKTLVNKNLPKGVDLPSLMLYVKGL